MAGFLKRSLHFAERKCISVRTAFFAIGAMLCIILVGEAGHTVFGQENAYSGIRNIGLLSPIGDTFLILKTDEGFYCLSEDGNLFTTPCVHYFDHVKVGKTIFHGFYYHDESGRFRPENPHPVYISGVTVTRQRNGIEEEIHFEGLCMAGSLGRLSAAPRVYYLDNYSCNGKLYDGYYYFDKYGRLDPEPGIHVLSQACAGRVFEGLYYFGESDGRLSSAAGVTDRGFSYGEDGRVVQNSRKEGRESLLQLLKRELTKVVRSYGGVWDICIRDLESGAELQIGTGPVYAASLIKPFVMARTFQEMDSILLHMAAKLSLPPEDPQVKEAVDSLLHRMITVSDNEAYNELVRLQAESGDFLEGARLMNDYLSEQGYADTTVQHSLLPAESALVTTGDKNMTSPVDCALLLERIYRGECVSREASEEMLSLLLQQQDIYKIPSGLPAGVQCASKSGDTETNQHDMGIVFGERNDYVLCVMSDAVPEEGDAIDQVREISSLVYRTMQD